MLVHRSKEGCIFAVFMDMYGHHEYADTSQHEAWADSLQVCSSTIPFHELLLLHML